MTEFYREHLARHSAPVLRALAFRFLCERKAIHLGDDELIVGERGPRPKAVPSIPARRLRTPYPRIASPRTSGK